ncbi:MAG: endo-1,4-beta-xylanase, partial [Candidatus Poribacteria bacterium]
PGATVRVTQLRHEFLFGTALSASMFMPGDMGDADRDMYKSVVRSHFNAAVHENALKWKHTNATDAVSDFSRADAVVDWCDANGIWMRGHAVFWGRPATIPEWVLATPGDGLRNVLRDRAREVVSRYVGRIGEYDLNNEMLRPNHYVERLGGDITRRMFEWARQADPSAALYVNDFNILNSIDFTNEDFNVHMRVGDLDGYVDQIRGLLADGVPLGGIGIQAHMFMGHPDADIDVARMTDALDRLAQFDLPIKITEFDMPGTVDEDRRARNLDAFYRTAFAHPSVVGIFMWGFWEGAHWMPMAALWTKAWQRKPAALAYENLVLNEWRSDCTVDADSAGVAAVQVFYGDHLVEVGDHRQVVRVTKRDGGASILIARYPALDGAEGAGAPALTLATPIGKLLQDAGARRVLEQYLGAAALEDPRFQMALGISLKQLAGFLPELLTAEKLAGMEKDLNAIER